MKPDGDGRLLDHGPKARLALTKGVFDGLAGGDVVCDQRYTGDGVSFNQGSQPRLVPGARSSRTFPGNFDLLVGARRERDVESVARDCTVGLRHPHKPVPAEDVFTRKVRKRAIHVGHAAVASNLQDEDGRVLGQGTKSGLFRAKLIGGAFSRGDVLVEGDGGGLLRAGDACNDKVVGEAHSVAAQCDNLVVVLDRQPFGAPTHAHDHARTRLGRHVLEERAVHNLLEAVVTEESQVRRICVSRVLVDRHANGDRAAFEQDAKPVLALDEPPVDPMAPLQRLLKLVFGLF